MDEKRKDSRGRILRVGESQRNDGRYMLKFRGVDNKVHYFYSWRLEPTDIVSNSKRKGLSIREKEAALFRDKIDGILPCGGNLTVADLVERYLKQKNRLRGTTKNNYANTLKLVKNDPFGERRIDQIKISEAKAWFVSLQADGKKYNTVHNYQTVLRPAFKMAVDDDLIRKNPFDFRLSSILSNDSVERIALTSEQEATFLEYIKGNKRFSQYYDGIYILFHTGLRISEFAGLTISDIDMKQRTISINHQLRRLKKGEYTIDPPKTERGIRLVPMTPEVYQTFRRILVNRKEPRVEPMVDGKLGFLFLCKNSLPMVAHQWQKAFRTIWLAYNATHDTPLPPITPHVCRHTFCSNMAKMGMNPKSLQLLMGHSSIKVTMDVYTHLESKDVTNEFLRIAGAGA